MTVTRWILTLVLTACVSAPAIGQDAFSDATEVRPLLPGAAVPDVAFTKLDGSKLSLSAAIASQPTVLIFYRGGW